MRSREVAKRSQGCRKGVASIVFIILFEAPEEPRSGKAECGEVPGKSRGGRKEVARRSQGGCKARAVIDFGPLGKDNIKRLQTNRG